MPLCNSYRIAFCEKWSIEMQLKSVEDFVDTFACMAKKMRVFPALEKAISPYPEDPLYQFNAHAAFSDLYTT